MKEQISETFWISIAIFSVSSVVLLSHLIGGIVYPEIGAMLLFLSIVFILGAVVTEWFLFLYLFFLSLFIAPLGLVLMLNYLLPSLVFTLLLLIVSIGSISIGVLVYDFRYLEVSNGNFDKRSLWFKLKFYQTLRKDKRFQKYQAQCQTIRKSDMVKKDKKEMLIKKHEKMSQDLYFYMISFMGKHPNHKENKQQKKQQKSEQTRKDLENTFNEIN